MSMAPFIALFVVFAALATLAVLSRGLWGVLKGDMSPQRSQELMRKRVLYQGIAIMLAVLLLLAVGN